MLIIGQLANCQCAMKYIKNLCPEAAGNERANFAHDSKSNLIVQNVRIHGLSIELDMNYSRASSQWLSQYRMIGASSLIQSCRLPATNGFGVSQKQPSALVEMDSHQPGCVTKFQARGARVRIRPITAKQFLHN